MTQTNNAASAAKEAMQAATGKLTVKEKISQTNSMLGLTQSEISSYLMNMKNQVAAVLPKHLTTERVLQMAATTIKKNPKIAQCTPASLLGAVMQASILGFPPVDALGYCYFVPYGRDVQFQIGYRGLVELARRSGKIKTVYAEVVREALSARTNIEFALQEPQLGTGHALQCALPALDPAAEQTLVLLGDVPLVQPETVDRLCRVAGDGMAILTTVLRNPTGYGRILRQKGRIVAIVEQKDATEGQKQIREVNTGIMLLPIGQLAYRIGLAPVMHLSWICYLLTLTAALLTLKRR